MNMKKKILSISVLVGLGAALAFAAGVPQKFPTDTLQIGIPGAPVKSIVVNTGDGASNPSVKVDGVTKTFEVNKNVALKGLVNTIGSGANVDQTLTFDTGDGVSNKKLIIKGTTKNLESTSNVLNMGDGAASDKRLIFNKGGSNAEIKYDNASSKLQFSHDGSVYKPIGSGSGGGGGISLIVENNPGFEDGVTSWTNSGGGATFTTSGTTPGFELLSGVFNSSAASQTLSSVAVSIPSGLQSTPCVGSFWYNTTESTNKYKLQVYDGTNVLSESTLESTGGVWDKFNGFTGFTCPSSGTILLRVISTGDAADISLDQAFLGEQKTVQISQAQLVGTAKWAPASNCNWTTSSTSMANFALDSDCNNPTVTGSVVAPGTKIPGVVLNNVEAGEYLVMATFTGGRSGANSAGNSYAISDGTNSSGPVSHYFNTSTLYAPMSIHGNFSVTSATSTLTFQLQGATGSAGNTTEVVTNNSGNTPFASLEFKVYKFPTLSGSAIRADQLGWKVDANITGTNPSLGLSSVSSYTGIEGSALTLTNNSGSGNLAAQIPCSSTNPSTGTTCAAGNESIGVAFNVPYAGDVIACASFTHSVTSVNTATFTNNGFQIVETANNAQTIIQEGKTRIGSGHYPGSASSTLQSKPYRVCGNFTFASVGLKTLRLMYEQEVSGTIGDSSIITDAGAAAGQRDVHWEVYPVNASSNIPVIFKGLVTTKKSGRETIERATIANNGTASVLRQSGSWITSATNAGTGIVNLVFASGAFSDYPSCSCTIRNNDGNRSCVITAFASLTTMTVETYINHTAVRENDEFHLICMGPN